MATIYYEILSGEAPFIASLVPNVAPDQYPQSIGEYYFTNVPDGDYHVVITDALGCIDYFDASVYCPTTSTSTTTTTTTCEPVDCGCTPSFDILTTPSIAEINVGELLGGSCTYDDYVIDWYDELDTLLFTTGKTFTNPDVDLIHPLTGNYAKPMEEGTYTARIRYVVVAGVTYYATSPPEDPCRIYCPGLAVDFVIEVVPLACGDRNLPVGSDYDWGITYNPSEDYIQESTFTVQLADGNTSGYLAMYFAADAIADQVQVWWGDADTGTLLAWYISGTTVTASEEPSLPLTPGYLSGDQRKAVVSLASQKPYVDGQILTVKVISSVNINTKWTLYVKCLDDNAFPETTNYFPVSLRDTLIDNISISRTAACVYTVTFDLPNTIVNSALFSTNFYKYLNIENDSSQYYNYSTGNVSMTFNKGDRISQYGWWSTGGYLNQIDTDGTCCDNGFTYDFNPVTHTLSFSVDAEPYLKNGVTYYSKWYYEVKSRWAWIMSRFKYGHNGALPYTDDENSTYHYWAYDVRWADSIVNGLGNDLPCGDGIGEYHSHGFVYRSPVTMMGITINPDTDITPSGLSPAITATLAALEKIGGVEQTKTITFTAIDPGGLSYTTTTTTTDEFGFGSCDTRSYDLWSIINSGGGTGIIRNARLLYLSTSGFSGRSICSSGIHLQEHFIIELTNDEYEKWTRPVYRIPLKSLADITCNVLTGWFQETTGSINAKWEYWFFLSYLKVTFYDQDNYYIEDYLDHATGTILPTGTIIHAVTTTTSTTLP